MVAVDLRSHGATESAEPFSLGGIGRDIDAVIAELKLGRAVVVGHSLGGCAAVEYAATHPDCLAAVNIDGPVIELDRLHDETGEPFDWIKFEEDVRKDHFAGTREELDQLLDRQLIEGQPLEAETRRRYQQSNGDVWVQRPTPEDRVSLMKAVYAQPLSELYEQIRCPLLIVLRKYESPSSGSPDPKSVAYDQAVRRHAERLVEGKRHFSLQWLGTGHFIHLEHPDELTTMVSKFVAGLA